jgi:hypothetical protein
VAVGATVRVRGYREFQRAIRFAGPDARRETRSAFQDVGESVRSEASRRFAPIDRESASAYVVRSRARGVAVESRKRKTTGKRPDFGALQMRLALLPAAAVKESETERRLETAFDRVGDHFEH